MLRSLPPHDFTLSLDVSDYFEAEYTAEHIDEHGFARPLCLMERDVLAVARFNEDPEDPSFEIEFPGVTLSDEERAEAYAQLGRILGTEIDTGAFAQAVGEDPVLGAVVARHEGFKRISRANVYEDALRLIIRTRISHEPTKKRMVQDVRKTWGTAFPYQGVTFYAYPRPETLAQVDPAELRDFGISKRKGEYITGLAQLVVDGALDLGEMEGLTPTDFHERVSEIRGIGPSSAQFLVLRRNRADGVFPIQETKGKERGMRKWIFPMYGVDPDEATEEEAASVLERFSGFEALTSHYLYYDWLMRQLEREHG